MTREEAIDYLQVMKDDYPSYESVNEALEMAIQALSQEPTVQEKQAESEKYQKAFDDGYANGYEQARFDYEQKPCDDAVSRKLAIRAIKNLYPDIPRVDFNGAKRKWADKYAQYIECERLIEQLPPVTQKGDVKNV